MAGAVRRAPGRERGAAAVEFALVVPLLLVLVLGIISYGYMLSFRQSISQAAAEAARAAAVAPASADRQAIARDAIGQVVGVTCGSAYLRCDFPTTCASDAFCVTVRYLYTADPSKPVFPGVEIAMPDELSYTAVAGVTS